MMTQRSQQKRKLQDFMMIIQKRFATASIKTKELVGYAEAIPITIKIENNWLAVLGLGGLNVHPGWRRQGFGGVIVEAVFKRIDASEYPFCLFQTGIPHFYEKLGCRLIENKFVNSNDHETPPKIHFGTTTQ